MVTSFRPNTKFKAQKFYFLPTDCVYVLCVDLKPDSDCVPVQH
jgi:hypothetical protein